MCAGAEEADLGVVDAVDAGSRAPRATRRPGAGPTVAGHGVVGSGRRLRDEAPGSGCRRRLLADHDRAPAAAKARAPPLWSAWAVRQDEGADGLAAGRLGDLLEDLAGRRGVGARVDGDDAVAEQEPAHVGALLRRGGPHAVGELLDLELRLRFERRGQGREPGPATGDDGANLHRRHSFGIGRSGIRLQNAAAFRKFRQRPRGGVARGPRAGTRRRAAAETGSPAEVLRMPLDGDEPRSPVALDGLGQAVGRRAGHGEAGRDAPRSPDDAGC